MITPSTADSLASDVLSGVDLSNFIQDPGQLSRYHDVGSKHNGLDLFKYYGYSWIRLRLLVANKPPVVTPEFIRFARLIEASGFRILLDLFYSDTWADNEHQKIPLSWNSRNLIEVARSYSKDVLATLGSADITPAAVQVGNEINNGILLPFGKRSEQPDRFWSIVYAGIEGVREGAGTQQPQIVLHSACVDISCAHAFFAQAQHHNISYNIIGLSYYPSSGLSPTQLGETLRDLYRSFDKRISIVETAHKWRPAREETGDSDTAGSQSDYVAALKAAMVSLPSAAQGAIFWWEPAVPIGSNLEDRGLFDKQGQALPALAELGGSRTDQH